MMNVVQDDVISITKTNRVGPQQQPRRPGAAEAEGAVRAIAVIPNRVVNCGDERGGAQYDADARKGEIAREEPDEYAERGGMIRKVSRLQKARGPLGS